MPILAALAVTLGVAASGGGAAGRDPHLVLFVDSDAAVQTVHPDGTGRRHILDDAGALDLAWSPDGTRIALTEVAGLRVGSVRAGKYRSVVPGYVDEAVWSPDGRWIAVLRQIGEIHIGGPDRASTPPPRYAVYLVHPDGHDLHRITPWSSSRSFVELSWSPDSRRLLAIRGARLTLLDLRGRPNVVKGTGYADSGDWSPDGRTIAYTRMNGPAFGVTTLRGLWLVRPDGTGLRHLTAGTQFSPVWSDGLRIAYTEIRRNTGEYGIGSVEVAGGRPKPLARDRRYVDDSPFWSPDGRWLMFDRAPAVDGSRDYYLWVVRADGSQAHELSHHLKLGTAGSWKPG